MYQTCTYFSGSAKASSLDTFRGKENCCIIPYLSRGPNKHFLPFLRFQALCILKVQKLHIPILFASFIIVQSARILPELATEFHRHRATILIAVAVAVA